MMANGAEHDRAIADGPVGVVFLEGDRIQYQPQNVIVTFGGDMLFARIEIKGQFLEFSTHNANPRSVLITGTLLAPIEYKE